MSISDEDRASLKSYWLGEELPAHLAEVLSGSVKSAGEVERRQEMIGYLHELGESAARQARRLTLVYGPLAVGKLVELVRGESVETSRKAAVDLLKRYDEAVREERAERAVRVTREQGLLAASVSDEQAGAILAIMADALSRAGGRLAGGGEELGGEED